MNTDIQLVGIPIPVFEL